MENFRLDARLVPNPLLILNRLCQGLFAPASSFLGKMFQVCVVLCFETFEGLRSLSPLPPFPPFTASRASFLLLKPNCGCCECSSYVFAHTWERNPQVFRLPHICPASGTVPPGSSVLLLLLVSQPLQLGRNGSLFRFGRGLTITFMPTPIFTIW